MSVWCADMSCANATLPCSHSVQESMAIFLYMYLGGKERKKSVECRNMDGQTFIYSKDLPKSYQATSLDCSTILANVLVWPAFAVCYWTASCAVAIQALVVADKTLSSMARGVTTRCGAFEACPWLFCLLLLVWEDTNWVASSFNVVPLKAHLPCFFCNVVLIPVMDVIS